MSSFWQNRRVLVTGGAGFLGSHLVDALVDAGAAVTVLDDLSSGSLDNLDRSRGRIHWRQGSLSDRAAVVEAMREQQLVFHLGANANVPRSAEEPDLDFQSNVVGSFHVLRAATESGIRVVAASSAAVYGPPRATPMDEAHPTHPISPYAASKLSMEHLGMSYFHVHQLPFTAVRIFNTFGERQAHYVMVDLLRKLSTNKRELTVLGTGEQRRSYCYVSDACRLFMVAAENEKTIGKAFNLAGNESMTIRELASLLIELLGLSGQTALKFTGQSWPGDIDALIGSGAWAQRELGFSPQVRVRDGLNRLIEWLEAKRGWRLRSES